MKAKSLLFLFLVVSVAPVLSAEKHVIGARRYGLFSLFFQVLNHIAWCEVANKQPVVYWDQLCLYFEPGESLGAANAWEYYFEPLSTATYVPGDEIHRKYAMPQNGSMTFSNKAKLKKNARAVAHRIIQQYIHIKSDVQVIVDDFYTACMRGKFLIGIHLRGTDKCREITPVDPRFLLEAAQGFAERHAGKDVAFFVASDEERLVTMARSFLDKPVIVYDAERSVNGKAIHTEKYNQMRHGLDILVEVLLMARCNVLVHTLSNVSHAALCFNPELESFCLTC